MVLSLGGVVDGSGGGGWAARERDPCCWNSHYGKTRILCKPELGSCDILPRSVVSKKEVCGRLEGRATFIVTEDLPEKSIMLKLYIRLILTRILKIKQK
jgi:hypothetical protein